MRKTQRRKTVSLCEDLVGLSKPSKVDIGPRTITLRGVKILGLTSKNGRTYSPAGAKKAIPFYEGAKINADHPDKPSDRRSAYDRLGRFEEVRQDDDGCLYGNAILLRAHPLAKRVAHAVQEGMEDSYAFSHNADGEARTNSQGVLEVEEITKVRSVDLVADGATNFSLFEGEQGRDAMPKNKKPQTVTLQELIEGSDISEALKTSLLEMGDDVLSADVPAEPEGDHTDDLVAAVGKLVKSTDPADHELAKKILAMLKPESAKKEGAAKEGDGDEPGDDKDKEKDKDKSEAEKAKAPKAGSVRLTEAKAKQFCKLAGVKEDKQLVEALCELPEDKALAHLDYVKSLAGGSKKSSSPRSSSPHQVTEGDDADGGKPAKDAKSFLEAITV
jgi:hypothetical protein